MVADTTAINGQMAGFDDHSAVWLFAYGSLLYKVDFPFLRREPAILAGWQRRFWQGSHDHRGTPSAPGRVVTLAANPAGDCMGLAYLITPAEFQQLDYREKNGYLRHRVELTLCQSRQTVPGVVYIADQHNAAYLGPASDACIARHIADCAGPSGSNTDYLLQLAAALRALGCDDPHVFALEDRLHKI